MIRRWTEQEDERLLCLISENLANFSEAFRLFHMEYPHRSMKAIHTRWYKTLRVRNTVSVCLATFKKSPLNKGTVSFYKKIINRLKEYIYDRRAKKRH